METAEINYEGVVIRTALREKIAQQMSDHPVLVVLAEAIDNIAEQMNGVLEGTYTVVPDPCSTREGE